MIVSLPTPEQSLRVGADALSTVLRPHGFEFTFRGDGRGSGGHFASGEFIRLNRRLELHYRHTLGLVFYHFGDERASHEAYMRELGVGGSNRYPGFSDEGKDAFQHLLHDLSYVQDFLSGDASILLSAARKEPVVEAHLQEDLMASYVGDVRILEKMHEMFQQKRYVDVVVLADKIKYPLRLTPAQRRLVELSRQRAGA